MSYNFDGKVANQSPRFRFNSGNPKPTCEKCQKVIDAPEGATLKLSPDTVYIVRHYLQKPQFIYETKSGYAVIYCSEYCRNKHNHRFNK
jgi:hypothetical protein